MNQRQVDETVFIPKKVRKKEKVAPTESPEDKIFDKAEEAESIEKRKERLADVDVKLKALQEELKEADEEKKQSINNSIEKGAAIKTKLQEKINAQQDELNSKE